MHRLIFIIIIGLISCGPLATPNKRSKVIVYYKDGGNSTLILEYVDKLCLSMGDLMDGGGNTEAYSVKSYSIIDSSQTIK